jgi:hypothetical protein
MRNGIVPVKNRGRITENEEFLTIQHTTLILRKVFQTEKTPALPYRPLVNLRPAADDALGIKLKKYTIAAAIERTDFYCPERSITINELLPGVLLLVE